MLCNAANTFLIKATLKVFFKRDTKFPDIVKLFLGRGVGVKWEKSKKKHFYIVVREWQST